MQGNTPEVIYRVYETCYLLKTMEKKSFVTNSLRNPVVNVNFSLFGCKVALLNLCKLLICICAIPQRAGSHDL